MSGEKTILELREIYSCLALSKNIAAKGYMTFILSSGMNRNEALALTIADLLSACHDDKIDWLLKRNPNNITPIWIHETEKTFKLNFSSPESLFYIFLHLKERLSKTNLVESDKLFDISQSTLDDNFRISEHLTDIRSYNPFSFSGEVVSHKFGAKALQEFFITQYLKHSPDYDNGKQRKYRGESYSEHKVKLIKLFTTGLPKDDVYCKKFLNNSRRLLLDYENVLPYVTAKNYDVIRPSWDEPSDLEIRLYAKVDKLMGSDKKSFTDLDVVQIVVNYVKIKSKGDVDIHQIIDFAVEDNKIGYFEDSTLYLDNLMLKPSLKFDLESIIIEDIEIHPLTYEPMIEELVSKLDAKGIFKKYNINKYILAYNIMGYLDDIGDKGEPIYLTNNDILELCSVSLMEQY
ncbi:hypothetical protein [uncultured Methanobrevibacter sp.]|uniref:hypothetical protein n=1 Tax=uncultured Methanobrevibacter sp. TaxID=253161 RepID=UPI0032082DA0